MCIVVKDSRHYPVVVLLSGCLHGIADAVHCMPAAEQSHIWHVTLDFHHLPQEPQGGPQLIVEGSSRVCRTVTLSTVMSSLQNVTEQC